MDFNTYNNYVIIFVIFLTISIIFFVINLLYYSFKKRGYSLSRFRIGIIFAFITSLIFVIMGIPFYLITDSRDILQRIEFYMFPIMSYNFSIILFGLSITLFIKALLDNDENLVRLHVPSRLDSRKGNIKIGRVLKGNTKKHKFFLSFKDLEKHMFICGATGTGKSNFLQYFLLNFTKSNNIPFFLVEFKGEYHFLQRKINNLIILWPGENFSINIFNPEDSSPEIHAERIFDILKSGKFLDENSEYSPQMEKVLVEILTSVCKNKDFRNWEGFENLCEDYLENNKHIIPMLSQTLISIKNRIRRFSKGPLKSLFETNHEIEVRSLFQRNVILDLSSIIRLGGEKEDALFFLNMVLKYLWDLNLTKGARDYHGIKHLTIIEDAQYFAPQDLVKKSKITTYLEDIALLQRGTGECLITLATRPDISKEILANNGIVLTFKNHLEKDVMCELLNLDLENKNFLSILEEGQCIIRGNSIKEPFLLNIPLVKRDFIPIKEIYEKNENFLDNAKINQIYNEKSLGSHKFLRFNKARLKLKNLRKILKKKLISRLQDRGMDNLEQKTELEDLIEEEDINQNNSEISPNLPTADNSSPFSFHGKLNLKKILIKFVRIQNLFKTNFFEEVLIESKNLLEEILKEIAMSIDIKFINLESFINRLRELELENKFILFNDILVFHNLVQESEKNDNQNINEKIESVFLITKKIVNILKKNASKKKITYFSDGYDEFMANFSNISPNSSSFNLESEKIDEDFIQLKLYVNKLYDLQNKK